MAETLEETGLHAQALSGLLLRMLYVRGPTDGHQLVNAVGLPFPIVDDQLVELQASRFIEVRQTGNAGRGGYTFALTTTGADRAREVLSVTQYVGPAPVPLEVYRTWVALQSIAEVRVTRERLAAGLSEIVLDEQAFGTLGPAVNSAKSLLLFGPPGSGKTVIAKALAGLLGGAIFVPYAVDVAGEIMVLYDPVAHRLVAEEDGDADPLPHRAALVDDAAPDDAAAEPWWLQKLPDYDRRFARVARPVVVTGGELTLEQLDLRYDRDAGLYQAPLQVKANGGVLIVDDVGRQRVPARDLLNRWLVALEQRVDFLALHTGATFSVPFDCLLILATNLELEGLVEEAFLRRIHYKVRVDDPTRAQYAELLRRACAASGMAYHPEAVEWIYRDVYEACGIAPRACHPRDLVEHVRDVARFLEVPASLSPELLARACRTYFVDGSPRR